MFAAWPILSQEINLNHKGEGLNWQFFFLHWVGVDINAMSLIDWLWWLGLLCILLFVQVEADYGPLLCVVHNIGANIGHVPIADTSTRVYTKVSKYNAITVSLIPGER